MTYAQKPAVTTKAMAESVTSTGAQSPVKLPSGEKGFQARVTGTGSVSATVVIEVDNGLGGWDAMGTITLSGTTSDSDGFTSCESWGAHRANVTAISGTGATVNAIASY